MPRNGTGTYTLPAGNPVITGTTISSTVQNNTMSDIANALTTSVSSDGQTPMTGALALFAGSTVPTAAANDSTTKIASTEFVQGEIASKGGSAKNRIINSDFRVNQRSTSSGTTSTSAAGAYTVDMWRAGSTGTAATWSISSLINNATFPDARANAFSFAGVAGNTGVFLIQRIESLNVYDLAGKNVTVQFYVQQTSGSDKTVSVNLAYANSADNFGATTSIATVVSQTIPSGVFTKVTATFAVPNAGYTGLQLSIQYLTGLVASQSLVIGNVQIESGSNATTFERTSFSLELEKCQRYFVNLGGTYTSIGQCTSTTVANIYFKTPTTLRISAAASTIVFGAVLLTGASGSGIAATFGSIQSGSVYGFYASFSVASGLVAGQSTLYLAGGAVCSLSVEL